MVRRTFIIILHGGMYTAGISLACFVSKLQTRCACCHLTPLLLFTYDLIRMNHPRFGNTPHTRTVFDLMVLLAGIKVYTWAAYHTCYDEANSRDGHNSL
ncbi:hypothetical protein BDB00DRAFT_449725 [Zychaea mexicana]|uniref:uncharacterized protein n=1 Tax=Zychaea mexicana TaxID=64656 RepID=UPI0022FE094A|nr:uncharacterized protein BDB00DRAFT_449725 [Zychaea mexicana]KAI9498460.1 hypothetical protein BDB00DRAFT_449725 [Zychaea mexicana]